LSRLYILAIPDSTGAFILGSESINYSANSRFPIEYDGLHILFSAVMLKKP